VKTSVFVGTSLDSFIARLNGAFDFLSAGGEVDGESNGYDAFFSTVDAVLMGRNTYEVVLPFAKWPYGTTPVFVLSSRPIPPSPSAAVVEHISGRPAWFCHNWRDARSSTCTSTAVSQSRSFSGQGLSTASW
jgi:dihydrofolate reductase